MPDPLLSTLCAICHTNDPKYTCPRCSSRTCSLTCSKRHKVWSTCNGIRDPTAYKPKSQLATPAGIDHDYNFLSAIERGIDRSDRYIVDNKKLIGRKDLRNGQHEHNRHGKGRGNGKGQHNDPLLLAIERSGVIVDRAPRGLSRATSNGTSWNGKQQCISWQVEWIDNKDTKTPAKILDRTPVGDAFAALLEEQRRAGMSKGEKVAEKKRRAREVETERVAKRARTEAGPVWEPREIVMQNPLSAAWDLGFRTELSVDENVEQAPSSRDITAGPSGHYFYLLRPHTPASEPRLLIPLPPGGTLATLLRHRVVLEFPTIYALTQGPGNLPEGFSVDGDDFGGGLAGGDIGEEDATSSEGFSQEEDDEVDDEDVEMEEGEIEN